MNIWKVPTIWLLIVMLITESMMQTCHYTNLTLSPQENMSTSKCVNETLPPCKFSSTTKVILYGLVLDKIECMEIYHLMTDIVDELMVCH